MKKILLSIAIVLTMGFCASAQGNTDGWFTMMGNGYDNRAEGDALETNMPPYHGFQTDPGAPLGSGLLILTALGAGYALRKRK